MLFVLCNASRLQSRCDLLCPEDHVLGAKWVLLPPSSAFSLSRVSKTLVLFDFCHMLWRYFGKSRQKTIYGKQKAQRSAENHCFCFKYSEVWYVVMNLVPSLLGNTWHGSYGSSAASRVLKSTEIGQDSVANTTCPGHSQHHLIPWQRLLSDKSSVREVNLRNML